MKKLNIATALTDINDNYINEAAVMPRAIASVPKVGFWQRLSHAVNSPLGVACICAIVAFGVLSGIVFAGQNPPDSPNPPAGVGGDTSSPQLEHDSNIHIDPDHTQPTDTEGQNPSHNIIDKSFNFDFSFTIDEGGVFKRGETYNIQTSITNTGNEITYTGSSTEFFAEATLIRHSGQTYAPEDLVGFEISALFPISDDYVTKTIPTGYTSLRTGHFFIPDSAPIGQYDLKISYKNEYIIYENAVSIYDEERFAFAYEGIDPFPDGNVYAAGGNLEISASVTNIGDAFMVYEDHSDSFVPTVKFVCRSTGYTFHATTSQSDDITTFEVATGQVGKAFYFADIPEDADAGVYDLVLSYSNESRTFYEVIQIVRIGVGEDETTQEKHKVEILNADHFDIINELKDSYFVGEKVTIQLATITEHEYILYVNGVKQERDTSISVDWTYTYYTFIMPDEDVVIEIEDRWVDIPDPPLDSGYDAGLTMLRYTWDGWGIEKKQIDTCDLGYAILDNLANLQETGEVIPAISDAELSEYQGELPVERGTLWLECGSIGLFRLNPESTEICKVQTHLGEGKALQMTDKLKQLLTEAWYYYPNDCWSGTYENGTVSLQQVYKADSAVDDVEIESINKIDSQNCKITLHVKANQNKTVTAQLESYQSDDNRGTYDAIEIELINNDVTTVELSFYGFPNSYMYQVSIMIDNTRINLTIKP